MRLEPFLGPGAIRLVPEELRERAVLAEAGGDEVELLVHVAQHPGEQEAVTRLRVLFLSERQAVEHLQEVEQVHGLGARLAHHRNLLSQRLVALGVIRFGEAGELEQERILEELTRVLRQVCNLAHELPVLHRQVRGLLVAPGVVALARRNTVSHQERADTGLAELVHLGGRDDERSLVAHGFVLSDLRDSRAGEQTERLRILQERLFASRRVLAKFLQTSLVLLPHHVL